MRESQAVDGEHGPDAADDTHRVCLERARRTPALSGWQLDIETGDRRPARVRGSLGA
jgi:hypothetical protein